MQESCTTTETESGSTGSSTASSLSSAGETPVLLLTTLVTGSLDAAPLSTQATESLEEPTAKRAKKKSSYYPAPKSRSKPWQRPRGKRGWIKKGEAEQTTTETSVEVPLGPTSTRTTTTTTTTTVTTHVCTESPPPRQLCGLSESLQPGATTAKRNLCAFCLGAPSSSSWCTCAVSFSQVLVPTLCAHCVGAPTGSGVCTCEHDLFVGLW